MYSSFFYRVYNDITIINPTSEVTIHIPNLYCACWSPNKKKIATMSKAGLRIFDRSGKEEKEETTKSANVKETKQFNRKVTKVMWNGDTIAYCSENNIIYTYRIRTVGLKNTSKSSSPDTPSLSLMGPFCWSNHNEFAAFDMDLVHNKVISDSVNGTTFLPPSKYHDIDVSNNRLAVVNHNLLAVFDGKDIRSRMVPMQTNRRVEWCGDRLLCPSVDKGITIWDGQTGRFKEINIDGCIDASWDDSGAYIAIITNSNIQIFDYRRKKVINVNKVNKVNDNVRNGDTLPPISIHWGINSIAQQAKILFLVEMEHGYNK